MSYNCTNCNKKHGPRDACGRGERAEFKAQGSYTQAHY